MTWIIFLLAFIAVCLMGIYGQLTMLTNKEEEDYDDFYLEEDRKYPKTFRQKIKDIAENIKYAFSESE